jgi:hypothetical protein
MGKFSKLRNAPRLLERTHTGHDTVADDNLFVGLGSCGSSTGLWLVVGAAIGAMLPIPLVIVTIPFVLTWIGDSVLQVVRGEKVTLD